VKRIPLCHRSECIDVIRRVATLVSPNQEWDKPLTFSTEELQHLQSWTDSVKANLSAFWAPKGVPDLDLWTDASDKEWAAMVFKHGELMAAEQGSFTGEPSRWHIFLKEAFAADVVIQATKGTCRTINIDNKPLVQCISRGFSSNTKWVKHKINVRRPFRRFAPVASAPPFLLVLP